MNKRQIIASLSKIANELDNNGLYKEATSLTKTMTKIALDGEEFEPKSSKLNSSPLKLTDEDAGITDDYELRANPISTPNFNLPLSGHSPSVQYYLDYRINNRAANRPNKLQQMIHREEFENITEVDSLFNFVFAKGTMPRNLLYEIFTNITMAVKLIRYMDSHFPTREGREWWKLFFGQYTNEINEILEKILVDINPEEEEKLNKREKYLSDELRRNVRWAFSYLKDAGIVPDEVLNKYIAIIEYERETKINSWSVEQELKDSPEYKYLKQNEEE